MEHKLFFLKLFWHRWDIPAKSRDIPRRDSRPKSLTSLVSRDMPNFLAANPPCTWKTPTRPKNIRLKSLGLCSFFVPEFRLLLRMLFDRNKYSHGFSMKQSLWAALNVLDFKAASSLAGVTRSAITVLSNLPALGPLPTSSRVATCSSQPHVVIGGPRVGARGLEPPEGPSGKTEPLRGL